MPRDWALVVGIDRYPRAGVDPLEGAVGDAMRFHHWVTRPEGGGVDPGQAILLTSPRQEEPGAIPRPMLAEIVGFFDELAYRLAGEPGRRLYIYLSGHGISPSGQQSVRNAALLMANAVKPNLLHNFPGNIWAEGVRSAALFREVVLFMDCCRDLQNNAPLMPHMFGEPVEDSKDCYLLEAYATRWASKAREQAFPPDDELQGVFTRALLTVLDAGRMSAAVFRESVEAQLAELLADRHRAQEAEIRCAPEARTLARLVFNEAAEEARSPVEIAGLAAPPVIEFWPEGADQPEQVDIGGWRQEGGRWQGELAPGQYELRPPGGRPRRLKVHAGLATRLELAR